MSGNAFKTILCAAAVAFATALGPVSVQAQNTNTTIQGGGQVCINRTSQYGDSNDNATYQSCKVNINRTKQVGGNNMNQTGQFGRINHNKTRQGRGYERAGFRSAQARRGESSHHRSKRSRGDRRYDN